MRNLRTCGTRSDFFGAARVDAGGRGRSKDWIVLENCRLISNPANDGDSFHASAGATEYIFRLYMVDAPETDEMTPARLVEQAKYFGITVPQAIEVGPAAKEFTSEKLSQPFTVFTHMSDAMGRSRIERLYAFAQTKEGDLGQQLVRNGLARNYGFKAVPPGLRNSRLEVEKLQQLEDEAKQEKIGGWGINAGRLNVLRLSIVRDAGAVLKIRKLGQPERPIDIALEDVGGTVDEFQAIGEDPEKLAAFVNEHTPST